MKICVDLQEKGMPGLLPAKLAAAGADEDVELILKAGECLPNELVPVIAIADDYRRRGGAIKLCCVPGTYADRACGPFSDGKMQPLSRSEIPMPFDRVWAYDCADGQYAIFDALIMQIAKSVVLGQRVKESVMWCLNEVMDNVLNHSGGGGAARGYVMAQFHAEEKRLCICVFDLGIGLKASLDGTRFAASSSLEAIKSAVRQGVTCGKGQGNGLWGLRELVGCSEGGSLTICSGGAACRFSSGEGDGAEISGETFSGYPGTTLIDFQIGCSKDIDFDGIFGEGFAPVDLEEENMETAEGAIRLKILELAKGTGTRKSAEEVRHLAENVIDNRKKRVVLDFEGVEGCSSSFIDELVGKLLVKYGFLGFTQAVVCVNVGGISARLVNHSISQRLAEYGKQAEG